MSSSVEISLALEIPREALKNKQFPSFIQVDLILLIKVSFLCLVLEGLQDYIVVTPQIFSIV